MAISNYVVMTCVFLLTVDITLDSVWLEKMKILQLFTEKTAASSGAREEVWRGIVWVCLRAGCVASQVVDPILLRALLHP